MPPKIHLWINLIIAPTMHYVNCEDDLPFTCNFMGLVSKHYITVISKCENKNKSNLTLKKNTNLTFKYKTALKKT